ncbi:MAG: VOC family protein [Steroidobacteraceae bacterium]
MNIRRPGDTIDDRRYRLSDHPYRSRPCLQFDVDSVENATADLESQGYRILVKNKKEPWGQTVTRLLSPEGLLVGITLTPSMRNEE